MMISGQAKLAGVMGWPVEHSQSPRLHGYWLSHHNINGAYIPLAVHPDHFETALQALPKLGFCGVNITVPHKESALTLIDDLDNTAQKIGAVNTISISDNGKITGYNTDAFGFTENLRQGCPSYNPENGPAVVLGAGGAARAVVYGLVEAGVTEIRLVNRTTGKAEQLAAAIPGPVRVFGFQDLQRALDEANLLVNTTSLGMQGSPPLDIDLAGLPGDALVNDIVYAPLNTTLLKQAQARGNPVVDGLGMLLHQARAGFEKWFGVMPAVTPELRAYIIKGMNG
jgi:shikimate dehydrogenase